MRGVEKPGFESPNWYIYKLDSVQDVSRNGDDVRASFFKPDLAALKPTQLSQVYMILAQIAIL